MKYMTMFAFLLAGGAAIAAETEPIYVFDVAGETVIDAATVKLVTGGETNEVAFSSLEAPTTGTIVKLGEGRLNSSATLTNFVGEVQVREGEFALTGVGQIGNAKSAHATVTVSDGASFVTAAESGSKLAQYVEFTIIGEGHNGKGVIRDESAVSAGNFFDGAKWTLAGDATVCTHNADRMGIGASAVIDLAGHTLTLTNDLEDKKVYFLIDSITVKNPPVGDAIVVRDVRLLLQNGEKTTFEGTAANVLKFEEPSSSLRAYWNRASKLPWTVDCFDGMQIVADGKNDYDEYDGTDDYFTGPFYLRGTTKVGSNSKVTSAMGQGLNLRGYTYGPGGLTVSTSSDNYNLSLMLDCPTNAFEGPVALTGRPYTDSTGATRYSSLILNANGALPKDGAGAELSNANLKLAARKVYELPAISDNVSMAASNAVEIVGGEPGSTAAALTKSGVGELKVSSPLGVTGLVDVARGRLTMPLNRRAGFVFGTLPEESSATITASTPKIATNETRRSTHMAYYKVGTKGDGYTWLGYMWNRSATNENWTFMFAMANGASLHIDGLKKASRPISDTLMNGSRSAQYTHTMTPGPHLVRIGSYSTTKTAFAPVQNTFYTNFNANAAKQPLTWIANFGMAVDRKGRQSADWHDYEKIEDPGDGSFITVSADGSLPDVEAFDCATISKLKIGTQGEAELNAMGGDLTLASLEGVGTIVNESYFTNTVTVTGDWKVRASQIAAERKLHVQQGKLAFGEGATLEIDFDAKPANNRDLVIAQADEGIEGEPTLSGEAVAKGWTLGKSADGKTLSVRHDVGCIILIK